MKEEVGFLKLLVEKGLIDEDEAKSYYRAFQLVRQHGQSQSLPAWLVKRGLITEDQCRLLTAQYRAATQGVQVVNVPMVLPVDSNTENGKDSTDDDPNAQSLAETLKASPLDSRRKASRAKGMRFGKYRVRREIARGGMGAVYEVSHPKFGETLALKVLLSRSRANERQRKRFLREVETIQRLDHPGIIQVFDAGEIDNIGYLTMEYVEGLPMDEVLAAGELSRDELVRIIRDLALALDHAHQFGVIHRDLKPANVLIRSQSPTPVLTDFGLAKDLLDSSVLSRTGTVIGTPRYLSPEQVMAEHERIDPTTDIYALGVMLYEILTGVRPFDADSVESLYQKIESEPPAHPVDIHDDVPIGLAEICLKALSKRQCDRYQSGEDMAKDIDCFYEHGTVRVTPESSGFNFSAIKYRLKTNINRIPPPVLTGILGALLVILMAIILLLIFGGAEPEPVIELPPR
ncbi:MAG: serine/threonine-protein kinase [Planctomycetota bacterium]|nr:serine/threonine-protein kinase [Planctomycetota bacterium]